MSSVVFCKECGGDAIPHRLTYVTVMIDETLRPLFTPGPLTRALTTFFHGIEKVLTPLLFSAFKQLGWAHFVERPDDKTILLARMLWEEADTRSITVHEVRLFGLARNMFVARLPNGRSLAYEGIPLPTSATKQVPWLDNKAEMKKHFRRLGIPTPLGGAVFTEDGALKLFKKLQSSVIVKPYSGSGSRHTTLHITDELALVRAFHIAKQVAPLAVIEEELVGPVFRATVVNGVCEGVLRRDPPHVIGTGAHNIQQLVMKANEHPDRGGPYFSKILMTSEALRELAWQKLSPIDMPEVGRRVTLHQKINWSVGGTTADVTEVVHPDNTALFEYIAEVLHAPIVGIDFIISDITRSWKEQERTGVIECNSMPFFDNHHLPFEGKPRNIAGKIWDMFVNS